MLLLSCRSVGRSVGCVCVFVYGLCCCPHTPGIAVCAAALLRLPPFIGRRLCTDMRSIQLCRVCAWTRSHISGVCVVCVCVSRTHTHTHTHATTNPLQHPHTHAYEHGGTVYAHLKLLLQHSFMIEIVVNLLYIPASSRATVPAEFKHINKRRKRNQQGFP